MTAILLTGAGFSRNWGGWLANEAFEYLLGRPELNQRIRNCLWKFGGSFENTFQELRAASPRSALEAEDFGAFNSMLLAMFEAMKFGFRSAHLETNQTSSSSLLRTSLFLAHFDAIYTLNQDTLIEQQYAYQPAHSTTHDRWAGVELPGLAPPAPAVEHGNQLRKAVIRHPLSEGFTMTAGLQPYIKLHGSSNWIHGLGHLFIVGGAKVADIERIPLLSWYHQEFRKSITTPDCKLMIVGYSFNDDHINKHLHAAAAAGAKMFIVDPQGIDAIDKRDKRAPITHPPGELFEKLRDSIVGASRRPLRSTLHNDSVELKKFVDFLGLHVKWVYDLDNPASE
jgi:SIR2-like domain